MKPLQILFFLALLIIPAVATECNATITFNTPGQYISIMGSGKVANSSCIYDKIADTTIVSGNATDPLINYPINSNVSYFNIENGTVYLNESNYTRRVYINITGGTNATISNAAVMGWNFTGSKPADNLSYRPYIFANKSLSIHNSTLSHLGMEHWPGTTSDQYGLNMQFYPGDIINTTFTDVYRIWLYGSLISSEQVIDNVFSEIPYIKLQNNNFSNFSGNRLDNSTINILRSNNQTLHGTFLIGHTPQSLT